MSSCSSCSSSYTCASCISSSSCGSDSKSNISTRYSASTSQMSDVSQSHTNPGSCSSACSSDKSFTQADSGASTTSKVTLHSSYFTGPSKTCATSSHSTETQESSTLAFVGSRISTLMMTIPRTGCPSNATARSQSARTALPGRQRVYLVRTAERCDRMFPKWSPGKDKHSDKYLQADLNQPIKTIARDAADFIGDASLTEFGHVTAQLVGRGLRVSGVKFNSVFCSPSLRSVQTATAILTTNKSDAQICIEPGLFDALPLYSHVPSFLSPSDFAHLGYKVSLSYSPLVTVEDLCQIAKISDESGEFSYNRVGNVLLKLINDTQTAKMLVVGHGLTLDAGARALLQLPQPRMKHTELQRLGLRYPYCSVVALEKQTERWRHVLQPPPPTFTYMDTANTADLHYLERVRI